MTTCKLGAGGSSSDLPHTYNIISSDSHFLLFSLHEYNICPSLYGGCTYGNNQICSDISITYVRVIHIQNVVYNNLRYIKCKLVSVRKIKDSCEFQLCENVNKLTFYISPNLLYCKLFIRVFV